MTLFDADALILLVAVALILLLVGVAAVLSLRARSRIGAIAGVFGAVLPMGALPIGVSLLWLVLTSNPAASSSSYMWLMFAAVIHIDRVFAIGALVSGIVYFAIPGTHRARLLRTVVCLAIVVVIAMVYALVRLYQYGLLS
jgi:hypothetical protein